MKRSSRGSLKLAAELLRWNKAYNLTAITEPQAVLTHHLLDSLAVAPDLRRQHAWPTWARARAFPGCRWPSCSPGGSSR